MINPQIAVICPSDPAGPDETMQCAIDQGGSFKMRDAPQRVRCVVLVASVGWESGILAADSTLLHIVEALLTLFRSLRPKEEICMESNIN